jgi:hypothetical protein
MGRSKKASALRAQKYFDTWDEARELNIEISEAKRMVREREEEKRTRDERRQAAKRKREEEARMVHFELDEYGRPTGALRIQKQFDQQQQQTNEQQPAEEIIRHSKLGKSSITISRRVSVKSPESNGDTELSDEFFKNRIIGYDDGAPIIDGRCPPNARYVIVPIDLVPKVKSRRHELMIKTEGIRTKVIPLERSEERQREADEDEVQYLVEGIGSKVVSDYFGPRTSSRTPASSNQSNKPPPESFVAPPTPISQPTSVPPSASLTPELPVPTTTTTSTPTTPTYEPTTSTEPPDEITKLIDEFLKENDLLDLHPPDEDLYI